jgi:beta-lactamase class C
MFKNILTAIMVILGISFSTHYILSATENPEIKNVVNDDFVVPSPLDSIVCDFDKYIQSSVDAHKTPGAAVAIVYQGRIILLKGYGVKKLALEDYVDVHTAFRLGSVSKGFASVLTGMEVDEGKLDWDDPINKYLVNLHLNDSARTSVITIKNILSHTSGFAEHTYTNLLDRDYTFDTIKSLLPKIHTQTKPGKVYAYQNVIYSLIGDVLYDVTDTSYNLLLKDKILTPLNMKDASSDYYSFLNNPNTAWPHVHYGKSWKMKDKNDRYYTVAAASGINASASDMAQWLLGLTGYYPDIISQDILSVISGHVVQIPMKKPYKCAWESLQNTYYGLGWRVFSIADHDIIYHGGYVEGFRSEIAFDPVSKLGIATLFNSNTSIASTCIPRFVNSAFDSGFLK